MRFVVWSGVLGIGPFILFKNGRVFEIALTVKEPDPKQLCLPLAPGRSSRIQPAKPPAKKVSQGDLIPHFPDSLHKSMLVTYNKAP